MTLALGHKSVTECKRWIGNDEFAHWVAYHKTSPIDGSRFDWGLSLIANIYALLINTNRKKGSGSVSPKRFYPNWLKPKEPQSWREMKASLMQWTAKLNDDRKNKTS